MFTKLRLFFRRRKYTPGAQLTGFLAPDIRRDVEVVDAAEVDSGYIVAKIRTWNLLYASGAGTPRFEAPRRVAIDELWRWTGQPWGGPVPDDDIARARDDD